MERRRIVVISDLHIGGESPAMLGHPKYLTDFFHQLAAYRPAPGERLELVINGDFIDFLAEKPYEAWTANQESALAKLKQVFERDANREVFDALASCVQAVPLTIILGNHDVELAYPRLRQELLGRLSADPYRCQFVLNNEAYRVGDLLIEHGNRYDSWNAIDHNGLRQAVSWASRDEEVGRGMEICPGSRLVEQVINPLKERYHFVDLLKPETKVVLLLLTAIESSLVVDLDHIFTAASAYTGQWLRGRSWSSKSFPTPGQVNLVAAGEGVAGHLDVAAGLPDDIRAVFEAEMKTVTQTRQVGMGGALIKAFLGRRNDSLKTILEKGGRIERGRLEKIRVALSRALERDRTFDFDGPDGPYLEAARRMTSHDTAKVVVMGHTHLARDVDLEQGRRYINTGTWADLIRVPPGCLSPTEEGLAALQDWLAKLILDDLASLRDADPTYADVLISRDGLIVGDYPRPMLRRFKEEPFAQ